MSSNCYGSASDVGIVREENQDAVYVGKNEYGNLLALVCDGLGGYKGGAIASSITRDTFIKNFNQTNFTNMDNSLIEQWFSKTVTVVRGYIHEYIQINDKEFQKHNNGSTLEQMATTIVLSIIANNKIYTFWIGDSRAYLIDKDKNTWQITLDHNVYNDLKAAKVSETLFRAYEKSGQLLALTNIISQESKEIEKIGISINKPKKNERYLLLCSDGFYNFVKSENFYQYISHNEGDMNKAANELIQIGMKNMSNDNLTVVVVDLFEVL